MPPLLISSPWGLGLGVVVAGIKIIQQDKPNWNGHYESSPPTPYNKYILIKKDNSTAEK
jgi:hypothetical protein